MATESIYRDAIVEVARSYIGQKEEPGNRGAFVKKCLKSVGLDEGYSWCGAFYNLCVDEGIEKLHQEGHQNVKTFPAEVTRGAARFAAWGKANHRVVLNPKPGDAFSIPGHHIGMVVKDLGNGYVETIEGNTNDNGSANGDGVYRHRRRKKGLVFISLLPLS